MNYRSSRSTAGTAVASRNRDRVRACPPFPALASLTAAVLLLFTGVARAFDQPGLNLGATSFLDGGPPAGPGFYLNQYLQFYTAGEFRDDDGRSIRVPSPAGFVKPDLDVYASLTQLIYMHKTPLPFNAHLGLSTIVPLVGIDLDAEGSPVLTANSDFFGDIVVGPFLQFQPIMGKKGPIFVHRLELDSILPTGHYERRFALNPGANFYSFNPYWSGTLFLGPNVTTSWRMHYLWNDSNDDPNPVLFPGVSKVQAGQALHLNFSVAYQAIERRLRLGINGYYLKQLTDSEFDDTSIGGRKEQVLGIGPGAVFHFNQENHLFLNYYVETSARNRPEGHRFNLLFSHHF